MEINSKWHIDSWAVYDGIAFASLRAPNSIKTGATVFLSVPDLEPIPVGRISTALRAQRNCFQDRFCDGQGNEFSFETLSQVQETIRRGYLSGGLSSNPGAGGELPAEPLPGGASAPRMQFPQKSGEAHFREKLKGRNGGHQQNEIQLEFSLLSDPEKRKSYFETLNKNSTTALYSYLQAFGEATLLDFLDFHRSDFADPQVRNALEHWIQTLYLAGLWQDTYALLGFLEFIGLSGVIPGLLPIHIYHQLPHFALELGSLWFPEFAPRKNLIFEIPCPHCGDWNKQIKWLHQSVLLPIVDRNYFATSRDLLEFIPLLFCALVTAVGPSLRAKPSLFQVGDRQRLMGRALSWINSELPSITLPEGVDEAITTFALAQLSKNSPSGDTGPAAPKAKPGGNSPNDPSGSTAAQRPFTRRLRGSAASNKKPQRVNDGRRAEG
jgi:hypothetical protein